MIDAARLAKFKRRAPKIATQGHLDRIMVQFPVEHHEEIATHVQPLLRHTITARKVESMPEVKPKDPENPTLHESTVMRLNQQSEQIAELRRQIAEKDKEGNELRRQLIELQEKMEKVSK